MNSMLMPVLAPAARRAAPGSARCTVTSSAVVGSSAISSFGSQASAMAIITTLLLAARQLVRIGAACARCGLGDADLGQQLLGARPGRWRGPGARCMPSTLGDLLARP